MDKASKANFGQTGSNTKRSLARCVESAKRECGKYREIGEFTGELRLACVVFIDPQGYVLYGGARELVDIIKANAEESLLQAPFWTGAAQEHHHADEATVPAACLKRLPKPLSQLNSKTLKAILPELMTVNVNAGRPVRWNKDPAPSFWPNDVVFANPKQRPATQPNNGLSWADCLRKAVGALYRHFGQDPETYISEPQSPGPSTTATSSAEVGEGSSSQKAQSPSVPSNMSTAPSPDSTNQNVDEAPPSPIPSTSMNHDHDDEEEDERPSSPIPSISLNHDHDDEEEDERPSSSIPSTSLNHDHDDEEEDEGAPSPKRKRLPEWFHYQFPSSPGYGAFMERERIRKEQARRPLLTMNKSYPRASTPKQKRQVKPRQPYTPSDY